MMKRQKQQPELNKMPEVDIQVLDKRFYFQKIFLKKFCRKIIGAAWGKAYEPAEVSLVLGNDSFIQKLNREYRGKNKPTNVLSFESGMHPEKGQPWLAGDIIIAYDTVVREAKEQHKKVESHLAHLLIHGILHLQGEDHLTEREARRMETKEKKIMKALGYADPYVEQ